MSAVKKRSVTLRGHRTSYSLEDEFFFVLDEMALAQNQSLASLVINIDESRQDGTNLSSALRLAALRWVRENGARRY